MLILFYQQFFIADWEAVAGWTWTFTAQALIMLFLSTLFVFILHKYGAWMRGRSPKPSWVNPEYDIGAES